MRLIRVDGREVPYPEPTKPTSSAVMRGNRKTDTAYEVQLRSALHQTGYRFRKNLRLTVGGLSVRPDLVFTKQMVAVFCDGCFWHACPTHFRPPRSNAAYWEAKILNNRKRDGRVNAALEQTGWTAIRIWEHEPITRAVHKVSKSLEEHP